MPEKSLIMQVRDTMLITVFVFLGIEGASVYSRYAKKRSDIGAATILGFLGVTGLMVAITLLPYATAPRAAISGVANPSLAGALELVAGHWGAVMIKIGVLVSVLGAFLAWTLITAEVAFAAAKSKDMPSLFAAQNSNEVPSTALWVSNIIVSLFIISTYWSRDAFNFMLDMCSVMSLCPICSSQAMAFWSRAAERATRRRRTSAAAIRSSRGSRRSTRSSCSSPPA